jgi:hypothetical protein
MECPFSLLSKAMMAIWPMHTLSFSASSKRRGNSGSPSARIKSVKFDGPQGGIAQLSIFRSAAMVQHGAGRRDRSDGRSGACRRFSLGPAFEVAPHG